jgi:hypothetical protein
MSQKQNEPTALGNVKFTVGESSTDDFGATEELVSAV